MYTRDGQLRVASGPLATDMRLDLESLDDAWVAASAVIR